MKAFLLILLIIASIVFHRWLGFNISVGGDWIYYYSNSLRDAFFHYSWASYSNLGAVDLLVWRQPVDLLKSAFGFFHLDSSYSDKLLIFWPTIIIGNLVAFFFIKKITKSSLAGFIGALAFNYNTYFFTVNSAYLLYSSAVWSFLSLSLLILGLERKSLKYHILSALAIFIAGGYDLRIAYIGFFLLFAYFLYYILFVSTDKKAFYKRAGTFLVAPIFLFGLLNLYWILGFISVNSLTNNEVVSRDLFGNEFLNTLYAFPLYHPFWTGERTSYFVNQPIPIIYWSLPIMAFASLWLHRKNKYIVFFGIVALAGIFFTKQIAHPFGEIYSLLFEYFPGFNAFREASKFYFLIALGYAVLLGAFADYIWKYGIFHRQHKFVKISVLGVLCFVLLLNTKPVLDGSIADVFIPRQIPSSYLRLNELITNDSNYFRTMWVPYSTSWIYYANDKPAVNLAYVLESNWKDIIKLPKNSKKSPGELMIHSLRQSYANNLLDMSSIRYVVVPFADIANKDLFTYYGKGKEYYAAELGRINYLKRVHLQNNELALFENSDFRPHVYTTYIKESLTKELPPIAYEVNYLQTNPTEYKLNIQNVSKPFYLHFAEVYSSDWKIRIGDFYWYKSLLDEKYFVSSDQHYKNEAMVNSYVINPKVLCDKFNCKKNDNGTYDMQITLYYAPQAYLLLGQIISGSVLLFALATLLLIIRRDLHKGS